MTSLATTCARRDRERLAIALSTLLIVVLLLPDGGLIEVIKKAANIPDKAPQGLGAFVTTMDRLFTPFLVASAAIAPIGIAIGVIMTQLGSRKGLLVIAGAVGGLVLLGSAKGIVL